MKTKPIVIAVLCVVILLTSFYFLKAKFFTKTDHSDVIAFLTELNQQVSKKEPEQLKPYFELPWTPKYVGQFLNVLGGKTNIAGNPEPVLSLSLKIEKSTISENDKNLIIAVVPVTLQHEKLTEGSTSLTFTMRKTGEHQYKIIDVDNEAFMRGYIAFESKVKTQSRPEKDIFAPITLQAFKSADQLKSRYDSVVWFSHVDNKTWFYVIKGEWDKYRINEDSVPKYKMGLVGPDLKEIIPAKQDMIYAISGTFDNLVEVRKDGKHGFYDLTGKIVLPVEYDQVFPIIDSAHKAVLRKDDDYYWLEKDYTVSGKVDVKIADVVAMLPKTGSFNITNPKGLNIIEQNSRDDHSSVLISPSYLVDLNLMPVVKYLSNPLRRDVDYYDSSKEYHVRVDPQINPADTGWFKTIVYSIRDYFVDGRSEFYDSKNLVLIDKKEKTRCLAPRFTPILE